MGKALLFPPGRTVRVLHGAVNKEPQFESARRSCSGSCRRGIFRERVGIPGHPARAMELPNYSRQLLQQLYTLCKEQHFCDCTILIGTIHFRAHKLVLAAASLLFKSLLDATDTISIDASVVAPEEFALLLEMMYTGKLPVGKHNFSKVISVADSLQMFDVAVSCKALLASLVSCSAQGQAGRYASPRAGEPPGGEAGTPEEENGAHEDPKESRLSEEASAPPAPGTRDAEWTLGAAVGEVAADPSPAREEVPEEETQRVADSPGGTPGALEAHPSSPPGPDEPADACTSLEKEERVSQPENESKEGKVDFLLQHERLFSEVLAISQDVLKRLDECRTIENPQKETLLECFGAEDGHLVFKKILNKVTDEESLNVQTVLSLLELFQDTHPEIGAALREREPENRETGSPRGSLGEGKTLSVLLLEHKEDLIQIVAQLRPIVEFLETAEEEFMNSIEKREILNCCEGGTAKEAVENLLQRVTEEKTVSAESLLKLLRAVKTSFPPLGLLLDSLQRQGSPPSDTVRPSLGDYGTDLLRRYLENLSEIFTDNQVLLKAISAAPSLAPGEREVMDRLVRNVAGSGGFSSLVSAVLEDHTLSGAAIWQLLQATEEAGFPLNLLMEEIRKEPGADFFFQAVATRESMALAIILRHGNLIREAFEQRAVLEGLVAEEESLADAVRELLSIPSEGGSVEVSLKAALSRALQKSVPAIKICQLLYSVSESFPGLQPVIQELEHLGLLPEETEEKTAGLPRRKTSAESPSETVAREEELRSESTRDNPDGEGSNGEKTGSPEAVPEKIPGSSPSSSKKSFVCQACNKSFHFYCRLKVHAKRCRVAKGKQIQCKECNETKTSKKELEMHQQEAHGGTGTAAGPKRKKKRLPVTCDICGREFAHASGMQYHKLTEHFDEKPFSCGECGAKFAANSTLKNHLRLHTGDRPFMCKHCLMTFTQASALAYHTKKKHSEGKMYACQYCDAVFAQSIELSRHVRTHTGDKPYVCRDCGKGFRQANGLSIHLRTFHNIEDPYDCKKCRMSFPTLQEHRKHIHEVHSREYHPCPSCGKIFSAPSLLERHMVTHVGGKPFSCEICDKAYQQLSGLWYHNRTHHPDVFAAQNHRSSKFSSLQCGSCDRTFSSTSAHKKHVKTEHADVQFHECDKCKELFPSLALLQVHVKCRHSGSQPFQCLYCAASFRFPGALQHHVTTEHFKQTENTFSCEVIQTPDEEASVEQQVITLDESQLAGSQVFVTLPDAQGSQTTSELVAVTMADLLDGTVTLICGEAK
ncbi:zinc finger and BTB domain-containing protein 40 isoform X2 [Ornithorhynchus anatinus]|uniref:Zinc finger and BTB domain containing 40 n=2 Tax=Ornithorhynchus anatinus TaxID=9258 RepID=A0A6I8PB95_ORNAN|nr:zinc finger and BTB domain-containing protein 40 isoform X2 [Ornithorhynchus anatinus]